MIHQIVSFKMTIFSNEILEKMPKISDYLYYCHYVHHNHTFLGEKNLLQKLTWLFCSYSKSYYFFLSAFEVIFMTFSLISNIKRINLFFTAFPNQSKEICTLKLMAFPANDENNL